MQEEQPAAARADRSSSQNGSRHMRATPPPTLLGFLHGLDPRSPDVLLGDGLGAGAGEGMCPAEVLSRWPGAAAFQPVR